MLNLGAYAAQQVGVTVEMREFEVEGIDWACFWRCAAAVLILSGAWRGLSFCNAIRQQGQPIETCETLCRAAAERE